MLPWIIEVKKPDEIEKMKAAGRVAREGLDIAGAAIAAFFISGVPTTLVLDGQKGTIVGFVFAFIAGLVARNEYKKYGNAYEEFLKENKDAWD